MGLVDSLKHNNISYVIYSVDVESSLPITQIKAEHFKCIPVVDTRSAAYIATGISAELHVPVAIFTSSGNSSRSAYPALTEAFYRQLPVAFFTVGQGLDYSVELRDAVLKHIVFQDSDEIDFSLEKYGPMHVELQCLQCDRKRIDCTELQHMLKDVLDEKMYLYIGSGVINNLANTVCKTVVAHSPESRDGALSNILGASLASKRTRYVGLISDEEYYHDINSLGNIHQTESLRIIVVGYHIPDVVVAYATSLDYQVYRIIERDISKDVLQELIQSEHKSVMFVEKETLQ